MAKFKTLDAVDWRNKRALVRLDLNVPLEGGRVRDATRIERAVPTLKELLQGGAAVLILSHFDRPKGKVVAAMSLKPLRPALADALGVDVRFIETDWREDAAQKAAATARPGDVLLFENTRFHPGEESNDPAFARTLARLGDVYVNDAFSASHRAHASTEGVAHLLPAVAGRALEQELKAISSALTHPRRPVAAVVGGAKVSTKLDLLGNLLDLTDTLIIGGAMANTFLAAQGREVGRSLVEPDLIETARDIMGRAQSSGKAIMLPIDAVVAPALKPGVSSRVVDLDAVEPQDMILDVGPQTVEQIKRVFDRALTLVWNGPLGAFEVPPFDHGTRVAALHAGALTRAGSLVSIAGGGDTVAALNAAGVADAFTFVSTAGGAFLEWLEGKPLPGITVLESGVESGNGAKQ
jgi:phosphoglycerate kinase